MFEEQDQHTRGEFEAARELIVQLIHTVEKYQKRRLLILASDVGITRLGVSRLERMAGLQPFPFDEGLQASDRAAIRIQDHLRHRRYQERGVQSGSAVHQNRDALLVETLRHQASRVQGCLHVRQPVAAL